MAGRNVHGPSVVIIVRSITSEIGRGILTDADGAVLQSHSLRDRKSMAERLTSVCEKTLILLPPMWSLGFLLMQEPFLISDTADAHAHTHTKEYLHPSHRRRRLSSNDVIGLLNTA